MSTNINISVGDNKLLAQARLQQNASRQAQLEKEANKRLQSQAIDARTKANAAAGKDANGNPLYGVPTAKPDIDRRPAASRQEQTVVGHVWTQRSNDTTSESPPTLAVAGTSPSGPNGTITIGDQFGFGELIGKDRYVLTCGNGQQQSAFIDFDWQSIPPSTQGYTWNPTYDKWFSGLSYGWYAFAYGDRTATYQLGGETGFTVFVLPAGKDASVVFVFSHFIQYRVELSCTHYAFSSSLGGTIDTLPPGLLPPFGEAYWFTDKVTPGASVDIGYARDSQQVPLHPFNTPTTSVRQFTSVENRVFYCTNTGITQLSPTTKLNDFMNWVNPPLSTQTLTIDLALYDPVTAVIPIISPNKKTNVLDSLVKSTGFNGPQNGLNVYDLSRVTPQLFASLNAVYPYTDPANIKTYDAVKSKLTTDTRTGAYALPPDYSNFVSVRTYFESDTSLNYAKNSKSLPLSDLGNKSFSLTLNPNRTKTPPVIAASAIWDWGDPAYCRARLIDLGVAFPA